MVRAIKIKLLMQLYITRVLLDEEIFPGVQIPALLRKSGVQKENPRASAFDSGWREGRERRGRSSFLAEEPKDPMLTLAVAAVVELE